MLLVCHELSVSGAPMMLFVLAGALRERGYPVLVASSTDGPFRAVFETAGFELRVVPDVLLEDAPLAAFGERAGIVIANTIHTWHVVHTAHAQLRPCIFWVHESEYGEQFTSTHQVVADAFALASAVVFPAAATTARYRRFAVRDNFATIHYGLDLPAADGSPALPAAPGKLRIAQIGSLEARKGQDVLMRAIAALPPDVARDTEVYVIGQALDSAYSTEVSRAAERLPNVRLMGAMDHAATLSYLRAMDVLVLASRDEVLPVTILEAIALGKPVVATRAGGVPEMIEDGVSGFVVDVNDHYAMAEALVRLFRDRNLLARMGEAACARHREEFGLRRFADEMVGLIGSVVENYRPYLNGPGSGRTF